MSALEQEFASCKSAFDDRLQEVLQRCEASEEQRRAKEAENESLAREVESLRRIRDDIQENHEKEVDELETRLSELAQGHQVALNTQKDQFLAEIDELRSSLSAANEELREAGEKIYALEDAREEVLVTDEKLELEAKIREVESRLATANHERDNVLAAKANAEAQIMSLASQIESLQTFAAERQAEWEAVTNDLDERIAENLSYSQEIKKLKERLEEQEQDRSVPVLVASVESGEWLRILIQVHLMRHRGGSPDPRIVEHRHWPTPKGT
jgi:chromosome segregation ATPase